MIFIQDANIFISLLTLTSCGLLERCGIISPWRVYLNRVSVNIVFVPLLCLTISRKIPVPINLYHNKIKKKLQDIPRTNRHIMLFSLFVLCGARCCIHLNTWKKNKTNHWKKPLKKSQKLYLQVLKVLIKCLLSQKSIKLLCSDVCTRVFSSLFSLAAACFTFDLFFLFVCFTVHISLTFYLLFLFVGCSVLFPCSNLWTLCVLSLLMLHRKENMHASLVANRRKTRALLNGIESTTQELLDYISNLIRRHYACTLVSKQKLE